MAPVQSCYGKTCPFREFCSHARDFKSCRNCTDLLIYCNQKWEELHRKYPSCSYICRERELIAELNASGKKVVELNATDNALQLEYQDGGLDYRHYILMGISLLLLALLIASLLKQKPKRWLQKKWTKVTQEETGPESEEMISGNSSLDSHQDPEPDGASSSSNNQPEENTVPQEPSAPPQEDVDEVDEAPSSNSSSANGTTTAAEATAADGAMAATTDGAMATTNGGAMAAAAPNGASSVRPELSSQSGQTKYPVQTQDRTIKPELHDLESYGH